MSLPTSKAKNYFTAYYLRHLWFRKAFLLRKKYNRWKLADINHNEVHWVFPGFEVVVAEWGSSDTNFTFLCRILNYKITDYKGKKPKDKNHQYAVCVIAGKTMLQSLMAADRVYKSCHI